MFRVSSPSRSIKSSSFFPFAFKYSAAFRLNILSNSRIHFAASKFVLLLIVLYRFSFLLFVIYKNGPLPRVCVFSFFSLFSLSKKSLSRFEEVGRCLYFSRILFCLCGKKLFKNLLVFFSARCFKGVKRKHKILMKKKRGKTNERKNSQLSLHFFSRYKRTPG